MITRCQKLGTFNSQSGYMSYLHLLRQFTLVTLLVVSILHSSHASIEQDNDLVFDASEEDEQSSSKSSIDFFGWFGYGGSDVKDDDVQSPPSKLDEPALNETHSRVTRQASRRRNGIDDDEDIYDSSGHDDLFGEGSASHETITPSTKIPEVVPGKPYFYRITIHVNEPYTPALSDRNSEEFKRISKELCTAVIDLYKDLAGRRTCNVLKMTKLQDAFFSHVLMDLGTLNYYDENTLRRRLTRQIEDFRTIGSLPVLEEGFTFRQYGAGQVESPGCLSGQLECRSHGQCYTLNQRCNGIPECSDGTDEEGCPSTEEVSTETYGELPVPLTPPRNGCRADDSVRCADGTTVICAIQKCDGIPDCPDGDDEDPKKCPAVAGPQCTENELRCDENLCIPIDKKCDGRVDCKDSADELDCNEPGTVCSSDEFECADVKCIQLDKKCDGRFDCKDGEDENDCPTEPPSTQPTTQEACDHDKEWQCDDGTCIDKGRRCNGRQDCPTDRSDETGCNVLPACTADQFRCTDGTCIPHRQRCNENYDCPDQSDEKNCPCLPGQFICDNGFCVPGNQRCNNVNNCQDGSDERNCPDHRCATNEFQCRDYTCIRLSLKCNGHQDCSDGFDEENCAPQPTTCNPDQYRCNDGLCLNANQRCNGIRECIGGEDEYSCSSCRPDQFRCKDGKCIDIRHHCDRSNDCSDGSDEELCGVCNASQFRCSDGSCIDADFRCDTYKDCPDGSDEKKCDSGPSCGPRDVLCGDGKCVSDSVKCDGKFDCIDGADERDCGRCATGDFRCESGQCIDGSKRCNKEDDCSDGSDELDCDCKANEFQCSDGICIAETFKCDAYQDCEDGSDELNCESKCKDTEFSCDNACFPLSKWCDGHLDCSAGVDEASCPTARPTCNPNHQLTCRDGSCVDLRYRCDGRRDCNDGYDEEGCAPATCSANEMTCRNGQCVSLRARCDGRRDCFDGTDEERCATSPPVTPGVTDDPDGPTQRPRPCGRDQFSCLLHGQCVPSSAVCDGKYDCNDYSDEANCASHDRLDLRTYPTDQIIKESREVVFQCRDEGPIRAAVHWVREGNLPLPPGSRDVNGRLEMPNIQLQHTGSYVCEAIGYPASTPGSRVTVYLKVEPYNEPTPRPSTACNISQATCSNGQCIDKHLVCNGVYDCRDGTDEHACGGHRGCQPNEYQCNNKKCILKSWRCDSDNDCGDNSDEMNCATNPPGSACMFNEFQCRTGNQCIPKSFQCDHQNDCQDGSDELGCSAPVITVPPPPMVVLDVGAVLTITCTAIGVPTPEVSWRLNWGHVPQKCTSTSVGGVGTLICNNIQEADQGAYSCEAINSRGSQFAIPDSILVVNPDRPSSCPRGYFNELARTPTDCIQCFCFGVTEDCKSADLFTYQLPPPIDSFRIVGVDFDSGGRINVRSDFNTGSATVRSLSRAGFQLYGQYQRSRGTHPYFAMPENYHGNQLKSYGGYLQYTVKYDTQGRPVNTPSVIISGNGKVLVHPGKRLYAGRDNDMSVRFFYGEWYKLTGARTGGDIPAAPSELATRAEIMMVLANIDNILIKTIYEESSSIDTSIFNIRMDSAGIRNTGQGQASYVEECRCPAGYTGFSCEQCATGYTRRAIGPWLGMCVRDEEPCPPGQYGDPRQNIPCQVCPCPLTNPSNQFGRTCHLDSDNQVTCNCPEGYSGRRCEHCASGYTGNPLLPGDICRRGASCNPVGSLSPNPDPAGLCRCKEYAVGPTCNQCQANAYYMDENNQFGCISCFCMGIQAPCQSSNWYRDQVSLAFTSSTHDVKLVESFNEPISEGIRLNPGAREIVYQDFNPRSSDAYYWSLPPRFLGDKVTSYGGYLNYTVRYVPAPGGQSSRNNAFDVEIKSAPSTDIKLRYFSRKTIEPNRPQTVSVPLYEQFWQRPDGQTANREHFLMALANLEYILIKATYTTNTREAGLIQVSLDIADERNTGQQRALAVEQCTCPAGYRGLSCENCDVGYTRAEAGLYLGMCEPCDCNGHSTECDPETGVCQNCRDHTAGDNCDICEPGYDGDASQARGCQPTSGVSPTCECDRRGSLDTTCADGYQCQCKTNVEGRECDRCRAGTFALMEHHVSGCLECFCSGVTDDCQSSALFSTQIPMQIIDQNHRFTLTDSNRQEVIQEGFNLNFAQNEIGYIYPEHGGQQRRLFWSLPPAFTGNKVTSYGGNLAITQRYTAPPGSSKFQDTDVIIIGNGINIYWTNNANIAPGEQMTFQVPLVESSWHRVTNFGPRPASRADLLTALADIEAILVRATFSTEITATFISDISMDIAMDNTALIGQPIALEVEMCRCPAGYKGPSCERCSPGYYRDPADRSSSVLGSCRKCPCNGNGESCSIGPDLRVTCNCLPGYTGRYCDSMETATTLRPPQPSQPPLPPTISISVSEPTIQIVGVGETVQFRCSGRSLRSRAPVTLYWRKEAGELPRGRSSDNGDGLLVITNVRVSDSGYYICIANDSFTVATERASLTVGGSPTTPPQVVVTPRSLERQVGQVAEFRCVASGNPTPAIRWTTSTGRALSPDMTFNGESLRIVSVRLEDAGQYVCIATNSKGTDQGSAVLYVREAFPEDPTMQLTIEPAEYQGQTGEVVQLRCKGPRDGRYTYKWSRGGGAPLPASATQTDGILTIYNPSPADSDIYICTVTSTSGSVQEVQARVTILSYGNPPTVRIEPDTQTISQGTSAELRCHAVGEPTPIIKWSKVGEELGSNVYATGSTLRISNALVRNRGVYLCIAENSGGTAQAPAVVEVERREPPTVELYPGSRQTVIAGGSALIQCRVTGGIPTPTLRWSRGDGRPLSSNIQELTGGVLSFNQVTRAEEGEYMCVVENNAGTASASASLEIHTVPVISGVPSSPMRVAVGQLVRLECHADGKPVPTVTWKRHRPGYNIFDISPLTSATSQRAVYEISRVTKSDEGIYSCVAQSPSGNIEETVQIFVTSSDTDVIPAPRPSPDTGYIETDRIEVPVGGRAELRCHVRGNRERIFINWIRADRGQMRDHQIQDGILYLNNVQQDSSGEYICIGVGAQGVELFRTSAHLSVVAPLRINLNPSRQIVRPGDNALITCTATGEQPINLRWTRVGEPMPRSVQLSGGRLQFYGIQISDAGRYVCQANNPHGNAEGVAEVIVDASDYHEQVIRAEVRDTSTSIGSRVRLRCTAPGNIRVTWRREHRDLPPNAVVQDGTLIMNNVQLSDAGQYICEAHSPDGRVSSDYINLHIDPTPGIHHSPVSVAVEANLREVRVGDTVDVTCRVTGDPNANISWTKVGDEFANNIQVAGAFFRVNNVRTTNGGLYRCTARTAAGIQAKDYVLSIRAPAFDDLDAPVTPDPIAVETRTAPHGTTVDLVCRTNLEEPVTYTWVRQGALMPRKHTIRGPTLSIPDVNADDAGTYICTAQNNEVNMKIPTLLVVTGVVPYFAQAPNSFMALPTLADAYYAFNIEIAFKPESPNGLILYNGQSKGSGGDFISFGLDNGYAEFRFLVGGTPAIIRSAEPLQVGEWHTVKLNRSEVEGYMMVDGMGPYTGRANGPYKGLDLKDSLYVGGVPDFKDIHKLAGFNTGFVGCISRLVLGTSETGLLHGVLLKQGVTTCETCAVNKCQNNGVCQEAQTEHGYMCICPSGFSGLNCDSVGEVCYPGACGTGRCANRPGGFDCFCPMGTDGQRCEKEIRITEPAFTGGAFIAYDTPRAQNRLKMEMKFKPLNLSDGILLYSAQSSTGVGDFISLAIRDKKVEFRFDVGSGSALIQSTRELETGRWYKVVAGRDVRLGHLAVDNETRVMGRSPGNSRGLNLGTPLYIGGYDKSQIVLNPSVGVETGFEGCISEVEVTSLKLDIIKSAIGSSNILECDDGSPCKKSPCLNDGVCEEQGSGYTCTCPEGFRGHNCEIEDNLCQTQAWCKNGGTCVGTATYYKCNCPRGFAGTNCDQSIEFGAEVGFQGDGYLELRKILLPHRTSSEADIIHVQFSAQSPNGLLLWHGQTPETDGKKLDGRFQDYLALAVVDGYLQFSWELGSGRAVLTSPVKVDDGKRYKVKLWRQGNNGTMELEGYETVTGLSQGSLKMLNTEGNIYLGGVPSLQHMTGGLYNAGFSGCIHSLQFLDSGPLNLYEEAVSAVNAKTCSRNSGWIPSSLVFSHEEGTNQIVPWDGSSAGSAAACTSPCWQFWPLVLLLFCTLTTHMHLLL